MATTTTPVESLKEFKGPQGEARRWLTEIKLYDSEHKQFWKRCDKIINRYRNSYGFQEDVTVNTGTSGRRFALLWANVQTLQPTIFAKPPKADVQRRFKDKDPVGRLASEIAERCLDYFIDNEDYIQSIKNARDDFLIVGLGVHWQRYVPHFKDEKYRVGLLAQDGPQITNDGDTYSTQEIAYKAEDGEEIGELEIQTDEQGPYIERVERVIDTEEVVTDYVNWRDFGHSPGARTWAEVYCVWRKAFMTRQELIERFGEEEGKGVQLDYSPKKEHQNNEDNEQFYKKATIYEIWDKSSKKVYWVANSYDGDVLDVRDDPLGVDGFFPCQMPLFSNLSTNSLIPVADYVQYQDQAEEMDRLTEKIYTIMDAIRVRGLYAANIPELTKLLQDGSELDFTPVTQSILTMTNGDISKAVWVWPISDLVAALRELIAARERVKQDAYEITGISDIIRGATDPNETLGAQQLKAQTGAIRIRDRQQDMARFIRDGLRIKFDVIVNHFQPETIMRIADVRGIPEFNYIKGPDGQWASPEDVMKKLAPPAPAGGVAGGGSPSPLPPSAPPQMPQIPPQGPTLGETAIQLLQDKTERRFRIDIETDSTIEIDQATEKAERTEFVTAVSQFITSWAPILQQAPQTAPLFGAMLSFAVRGFRAGDQLEGVIDEFTDMLEEVAKNPPPPQPDPAMVKAEADAKAKQMDMQIKQEQAQATMANDQAVAQREAQAQQAEMFTDQQRTQMEMALEAQRGQVEKMLAAMEIQGKNIDLLIAKANLKSAEKRAEESSEMGESDD